ncbi:hypothetical protein FACS1894132_08670 [Clostridia bacterium]|nr:hypothetical protein FACS1894132_08670 [Clostridia bacterium]
MLYKVIPLEFAVSHIEKHIEFLSRVNIQAAKRLRNSFNNELKFLGKNPFIGIKYQSNKCDNLTFFSHFVPKYYRFVYRILRDTVYIYDVQDCRQNTDKSNV